MNAIFVIVVLQMLTINEIISAKKHSKSFSFQNKSKKLYSSDNSDDHNNGDYGLSNDIEHQHHHHHDNDDHHEDDDDDDDHHNDHHGHHHHHSMDDTYLVKNPSKKVVKGNTISQLIGYKQFLANSMFNLMTRPGRKVKFGVHYSKKTHPKTVYAPKGVVYSGEKDENHNEPSIIVATNKHSSVHPIMETSDAHHKPGYKYHNFYGNVGDNGALYGHHHQYYYPNFRPEINFEYHPNSDPLQSFWG